MRAGEAVPMNRRGGGAVFVVGFALVPWLLQACQMAANVLEDEPSFGEQVMDGGWGGTMAMAAGGTQSTGGLPGVFAGGRTVTIADGGVEAGGGPTQGAGGLADANADARRALADQLCSIPMAFTCIKLQLEGAPPNASVDELRTLCRQKTETSQYRTFGDRCFTQWALNASCALQRTDYCPCDAENGGCVLSPETHDYGPACSSTLAQLSACSLFKESYGTEFGKGGTYEWSEGSLGCTVKGTAGNGVDSIAASCQGPPNGAQACTCAVNGVTLVDHVQEIIRADSTFYADDCWNVAKQLASGKCADVLECCFESAERGCHCGAHPELAGYESCAALASAYGASVVEQCPAYRQ
jgi:hypothetical protein